MNATHNRPNPENDSPVPPSSSRLQMKYMIIGIILLMIGLVGGWFIGSTKTQKTAELAPQQGEIANNMEKESEDMDGWKTFISDYNNTSFKYPPQYEIEDRSNYTSIMSPINKTVGKIGRPINSDELKVEIILFDSIPNDSLSKWREELQKETSGTIADLGITTIGGAEAQILIGVGVGTTKIHLMIHEGKRYMIIKYPFSTTRDLEFDQILSTFKFVKNQPSKSDATQSLQTYDNLEYGFSFLYPSEAKLTENKNSGADVPYQINLSNAITITIRDPKISKEDILRNWTRYEEIAFGDNTGYKTQSLVSGPIGGNPTDLKTIQYFVDMPTYNLFIFYNEALEQNGQEEQSLLGQLISSFRIR